MRPRSAFALLLLLIPRSSHAEDWPQWMGPERNGLSRETGLLGEWPDGGPPVAWLSRGVGLGYSGPAVVGKRLYTMGAFDGRTEALALDAATGDGVWRAPLGEAYENGWGDGPRGTPTVDGDVLYVLAAGGKLACLQVTDGSEVWSVRMQDFGGKIPTWGYAASPLVDGDRLIVTPGSGGGAILALDKRTGEPLWQTDGVTTEAHYSSVVRAEPNGQPQYVQLLRDRVLGVSPESGEVLWTIPWGGEVAVIPTPLVRGNRVYVTSGYGVGCLLAEIASEGNKPTVVFKNKAMKNHHGGVLLIGEHLYGHSDGVGWLCQDFATGKRVWRERGVLGKGAIAHADGRLYCLDEQSGEVALIDASPEGWTERGRFTLTPQTELRKPRGKIWTHPVIANGRMYLRDQELLFSFDVSAGQ